MAAGDPQNHQLVIAEVLKLLLSPMDKYQTALVEFEIHRRSSAKAVAVSFQQLLSRYFEVNYNESPYTT